MATRIGVDIEVDASGLDKGLTDSTKRVDDFSGSVKRTAGEVGASALKMSDSLEMSAKQTRAALRMVPAQLTDVVTQLAGGQSPLLVLLQQGGQLKDMFGGIGPAVSAMGSYMASLINPVTLAAGAIGVLGLAYSKGAEEQENFSRTLILNGGAAGVSAGQLMDAARTVATATGATQSSVAGIMNVIVASGQVSADMLTKVAKAAVDLERAGGPAAAATVKEFIALGEKPVEAVQKLQETTHAFTGKIFEQVKALADQGKATEAASLAQTAYADAIEVRVPTLVTNLGLIERAWNKVADAGKLALEGVRSIGREKTLEQKMIEAQKDLAGAYDYSANAVITSPAEKQKAQERINAISNEMEARDALLLIQKKSVQTEDSRIKQVSAYSTYMADQSNAPKSAKLAADIEKENKAFADAVSGLKATDADYVSALQAHNARVAQLRSNAARGEKDPAVEALVARQEEASRIRKQLDDELKEIDKQHERRARADQIVTNYNSKSDQTLERIARQNELIGVSERETLVQEALYKVEDEALQVSRQITEQVKDETERKRALGIVEDGLAAKKTEVAEATRKAYDESRTWDAGWRTAFASYTDEAGNAAKTAQQLFSSSTDAMADAMANFVTTGKTNFSDLASSLIADMVRIQAKAALSPLTNAIGNWATSLFSSTASGTGAGSASVGSLWGAQVASAKGNVFSGAPDLHQYVNTVQTSPKVFGFDRLHAFASGGIFAEENPEAVMPLARDGQGRLGIRSQDGGANVTVNVINNASGTQATQTQRSDGNGGSIIDVLIDTVKGAIVKDIGSGGMVAGAMESQYMLNRAAGAWG